MVEQGHNYLDCPIHAMAELFETKIENLDKSISPSVPSRNIKQSKKGSKKMKAVTFTDSEDKDPDQGHTGHNFCQHHGTCGHSTDRYNTLKAMVKQAIQKRSKQFDKKKSFTKLDVNVPIKTSKYDNFEKNCTYSFFVMKRMALNIFLE